jgi:hypothetical protein
MKRLLTALALLGLVLVAPAAVHADVVVASGGGTPGTASKFRLVGHDSLFNRGMNAAPAMYEDFVYVGNRTDGSTSCGVDEEGNQLPGVCPHPHPGILVVNVADPRNPTVVGEIGPPFAGNVRETTRELRVWPQKKLLVVLNFSCSTLIHACTGALVTPTLRFFDLSDPANPQHVLTFVPRQRNGVIRTPHEFYLWVDPQDPDRALVWASTPTISTNPNNSNMLIWDISGVPAGGTPALVAQGNWNQLYPGAENPANYNFNLALHSMAPTVDGTVTHLAYLAGLYLAVDTSDVADGVAAGEFVDLNDDLLTQPENRPLWDNPNPGHTSVPVPGRPLVFTTDEVYGTFTDPTFGCPWGWSRLLDVGDLSQPRILSEYKLVENTEAFCASPANDPATDAFTSYASHNPTVTKHLALVTWHSGGLQAVDITRASHPTQAGWFSPTPLASVATEDPALSRGPNKVVMWSYPIVDDGLIYVVDLRNGLYVLEYTGRHRGEVQSLDFYEGNSNLGDAVRLARRGR